MANGVTTGSKPEPDPKSKTVPEVDRLAEAVFDFLSGFSLLVWGALIYFSRDLNISLEREDVIELAQTTSALAGIALAALAILQKPDRFLKRLLAVITTIFVLATTVAWLTVLFVADMNFLPVHLQYAGVVGVIFFIYGMFRMTGCKWREWGIDFVFPVTRLAVFLLPVLLVGVWPSDKSSFGPSVALSLGGMIYLLAATIFLIFAVHRE